MAREPLPWLRIIIKAVDCQKDNKETTNSTRTDNIVSVGPFQNHICRMFLLLYHFQISENNPVRFVAHLLHFQLCAFPQSERPQQPHHWKEQTAGFLRMMAGASCSGSLQAVRLQRRLCTVSPGPPLTSVVQFEWPASIRPQRGACALEMSWSACVCVRCCAGGSPRQTVLSQRGMFYGWHHLSPCVWTDSLVPLLSRIEWINKYRQIDRQTVCHDRLPLNLVLMTVVAALNTHSFYSAQQAFL